MLDKHQFLTWNGAKRYLCSERLFTTLLHMEPWHVPVRHATRLCTGVLCYSVKCCSHHRSPWHANAHTPQPQQSSAAEVIERMLNRFTTNESGTFVRSRTRHNPQSTAPLQFFDLCR